MNELKKLGFILSWIPLLLIKFVLAVWGLAVVPIALWMQTDMTGLPVWGNREGVPDWWFTSTANGEQHKLATMFPQFWWYAIRNPVNNLRYVFDDPADFHIETDWSVAEPMEAPQLRNLNRQSAYAWRWAGWQGGYRQVWLHDDNRYSEIWFGWKIGSDVPGLGFTSQVRLKRKIGT